MTKHKPYSIYTGGVLFILLASTAPPLPASQNSRTDVPAMQIDESDSVQKLEPSEQDQLQVKLLSYQFLQAKDNGEFNAAFEFFSESTKSSIDFKKWKHQQLLFNATAGALADRAFTRITWYENPPEEAIPGIFATVDYSGVFTNVDIQCGNLMWHKKHDGSFELIREQENFIDKASQQQSTEDEIAQTKAKFGCKGQ